MNDRLSTIYIAKVLRVSPQWVQNMLHEMRIEMNPQHTINPLYFKTRSDLSTHKLLDEIRRLYEIEKLPLCEIAKQVGVWEGTVSSKLKAMGIPIITRRRMRKHILIKPGHNIIGIYKGTSEPYVLWNFEGEDYALLGPRTPKGEHRVCIWCNIPFIANISHGPRAQIYCNHKCRNKAKDLRRSLTPRWVKNKMALSMGRFEKLARRREKWIKTTGILYALPANSVGRKKILMRR